jgi:hypothetical protein
LPTQKRAGIGYRAVDDAGDLNCHTVLEIRGRRPAACPNGRGTRERYAQAARRLAGVSPEARRISAGVIDTGGGARERPTQAARRRAGVPAEALAAFPPARAARRLWLAWLALGRSSHRRHDARRQLARTAAERTLVRLRTNALRTQPAAHGCAARGALRISVGGGRARVGRRVPATGDLVPGVLQRWLS